MASCPILTPQETPMQTDSVRPHPLARERSDSNPSSKVLNAQPGPTTWAVHVAGSVARRAYRTAAVYSQVLWRVERLEGEVARGSTHLALLAWGEPRKTCFLSRGGFKDLRS
ncbi:hypothetical protein RRG08_025293 [Elysia crispata]|uniref:Uncharacterized protein n=1 Tax=Elysia crispata TaxID=231223 RepID=A0AAE1AHJ2_9GAST|nr:hypothetical protein RRG08_025293 [Elysia crispata]